MALVTLGLIVIDAFLLSVATHLGLRVYLGDASALTPHVLWGIFATLFTCLIHCMAMFYLVGTGKDVQRALEGHTDLAARYLARLRDFKWDVHPYATFACILLIAAAALGAAAHTGLAPGWAHFLAVLVALGVNAIAFFKEYATVHRNRELLAAVDRALYERGVRA